MKTAALVLLLSAITFVGTSCQKDDMSTGNIQATATSGNWRVSLFKDSGNDETGDFNGYSFTFNSDGSVTATKGGTTKTGSWSTSSNKFNIDLGPKDNINKPLGELTDDWKILSSNASEIRLADDNVSATEFLTFSKN